MFNLHVRELELSRMNDFSIFFTKYNQRFYDGGRLWVRFMFSKPVCICASLKSPCESVKMFPLVNRRQPENNRWPSSRFATEFYLSKEDKIENKAKIGQNVTFQHNREVSKLEVLGAPSRNQFKRPHVGKTLALRQHFSPGKQ